MLSTLHPVLAILFCIDVVLLFISCIDGSPAGAWFKWFVFFAVVLLGALTLGIPHI